MSDPGAKIDKGIINKSRQIKNGYRQKTTYFQTIKKHRPTIFFYFLILTFYFSTLTRFQKQIFISDIKT